MTAHIGIYSLLCLVLGGGWFENGAEARLKR